MAQSAFTRQLAHLPERRPAIDRLEHRRLGAFKAGPRHLADGAMHPDVGDLAHPPVEMRLESAAQLAKT